MQLQEKHSDLPFSLWKIKNPYVKDALPLHQRERNILIIKDK